MSNCVAHYDAVFTFSQPCRETLSASRQRSGFACSWGISTAFFGGDTTAFAVTHCLDRVGFLAKLTQTLTFGGSNDKTISSAA